MPNAQQLSDGGDSGNGGAVVVFGLDAIGGGGSPHYSTAMVSVFIVMHLLGRSLNIISLAGLGFAVGMVVDNAIVVLENIFTHLQRGESPTQAAIVGTKEVGSAMLGSTLTTVAVFCPHCLGPGGSRSVVSGCSYYPGVSSLVFSIYGPHPRPHALWLIFEHSGSPTTAASGAGAMV